MHRSSFELWRIMMNTGMLTVGKFLEEYSIGRTSFYKEVAAGRIPLRKFGRSTRITRADAEKWVASLPVVGG